MTSFDGHATGDQVVKAFASQVKGRTFVITGAGKPSIGRQMALALAKEAPAHILIASRTASKAEPVLDEIKSIDGSIKTSFVQVELSDRESVRRAAEEITKLAPRIDVLINSAGVMALKEYTVDKHGVEMQLSVNHVGHFLLTNLIMPSLLAAAAETHDARVVNLTSSGYMISPFRFDDWNFSNGATYDHWTGYGQSKTANVLFAFGLTSRLKKKGITATAVHPGYNGDTELGNHLTMKDYEDIGPVMMRNTGIEWVREELGFKNSEQISATSLTAALDPEMAKKAPAYLVNCQVSDVVKHASDADIAERLWAWSEELVGQKFEY